MKKLLISSMLLFMLYSCDIYKGEIYFYWQFKVFLGVVVVLVLLIALVRSVNKDEKRNQARYKKEGINPLEIISTVTYSGGHPNINDNINPSVIYKQKDELIIAYRQFPNMYPVAKGKIKLERIKDIVLDDATTIDTKITVGRILLVGIFALGWRKKKKNELAFVTIEWSDGRFKHSTIFSFEGKDAMQKANSSRNKLLKII